MTAQTDLTTLIQNLRPTILLEGNRGLGATGLDPVQQPGGPEVVWPIVRVRDRPCHVDLVIRHRVPVAVRGDDGRGPVIVGAHLLLAAGEEEGGEDEQEGAHRVRVTET
jgi:hypothetical protein